MPHKSYTNRYVQAEYIAISMDHREYNNRLFGRWAIVYDRLEFLLSGVKQKIADTINPVNKRVIDVATGTGSLAIKLGNKADEVIGVDLSPSMLRIAKTKNKLDNVSFLEMDASNLTFENESFDTATISLGLHDMPLEIRSKVLLEMKRVVKKGGEIFILEYDLPKNKLTNSTSKTIINLYESRYYLDFINSDFPSFLLSLGLEIKDYKKYLNGYLRFLAVKIKK